MTIGNFDFGVAYLMYSKFGGEKTIAKWIFGRTLPMGTQQYNPLLPSFLTI